MPSRADSLRHLPRAMRYARSRPQRGRHVPSCVTRRAGNGPFSWIGQTSAVGFAAPVAAALPSLAYRRYGRRTFPDADLPRHLGRQSTLCSAERRPYVDRATSPASNQVHQRGRAGDPGSTGTQTSALLQGRRAARLCSILLLSSTADALADPV